MKICPTAYASREHVLPVPRRKYRGSAGDGAELSIVLARGRRIEVTRGFDVETLRRVVVALEQA